MSTRANIYVTDGERRALFYRHCDGYPKCTARDLEKIIVKSDFDFDAIVQRLTSEEWHPCCA